MAAPGPHAAHPRGPNERCSPCARRLPAGTVTARGRSAAVSDSAAVLCAPTAALLGGAAALALLTVEALSLYSVVDPAQWCPFCKYCPTLWYSVVLCVPLWTLRLRTFPKVHQLLGDPVVGLRCRRSSAVQRHAVVEWHVGSALHRRPHQVGAERNALSHTVHRRVPVSRRSELESSGSALEEDSRQAWLTMTMSCQTDFG